MNNLAIIETLIKLNTHTNAQLAAIKKMIVADDNILAAFGLLVASHPSEVNLNDVLSQAQKRDNARAQLIEALELAFDDMSEIQKIIKGGTE